MKVYVTGDTHQHFHRFSTDNFDYSNCSVDDTYMIICGDFGGIFMSKPNHREYGQEVVKLDALAQLPITFVVVLGNHENYDAIEANYPITEWHGARARKIRDNIIVIERGEIFELDGKKFWCFGGALSTDRVWRTAGETWWSREQASQSEFDYGYDTFADNKDDIDYIITHDIPSSVYSELFRFRNDYPSKTQRFLERILWLGQGKPRWFCGHIHVERQYPAYNLQVLYENTIELPM